MSERAMQFRIGLFVLMALVLMGTLVILFSATPALFKGGQPYTIRFADAPGVAEGTPVRRSGVRIGEVGAIQLEPESGTVDVTINVEPRYKNQVRINDVPTLLTGLLGSDTTIDFIPRPQPEGQPLLDRSPLPPGSVLQGERAASVSTLLTRASDVVPSTQEALNDLRRSLQRIEKMTPLIEDTLKVYRDLGKSANESVPDLRKTNSEIQELARTAREAIPDARRTLDDIGAASRNFGKLSERLDVLVQTNQDKVVKSIDNLNEVLQRTASLLNDENIRAVNATIRNTSRASERLGDIALQVESAAREGAETMKESREAVKEGRHVIQRVDGQMNRVDEILKNLQDATKPFAERSNSILRNADEATEKLNRSLGDVRELFKVLDQSDGTLRRVLTDPSLYQHLDEIACQVSHFMPRLDRILKDFDIFADKLARHPESLGIGGVVRPGNGLKEPPMPPGNYHP